VVLAVLLDMAKTKQTSRSQHETSPLGQLYAAMTAEMRLAVESDASLEVIEAIEARYRAQIEAL
jgi:hypothetical protein